MQVVLEILAGPLGGQKLEMWEGQSIRVGRTTRAEFVVGHDSFMSGLHFSITVKPESCVIRDLGSGNGTFLNGDRIQEAALKNADMVLAGQTRFSVTVRVGASGAATAERKIPVLGLPATQKPGTSVPVTKPELLRLLTSSSEPLFALLDAARDRGVLSLLHSSKETYQSLYEGAKGEDLASVAPYLVSCPKDCALLPKLIDTAWGESWGVYLTCAQPFAEVRKHLRRFLRVESNDGEKLYFRFYDPRVLRVYIPTCTPEERTEFFGPLSSYLVEGDMPDELLLFTATR
jgi:pSer/pThr/pTyr-binding forkhead associated (FHA) protein